MSLVVISYRLRTEMHLFLHYIMTYYNICSRELSNFIGIFIHIAVIETKESLFKIWFFNVEYKD